MKNPFNLRRQLRVMWAAIVLPWVAITMGAAATAYHQLVVDTSGNPTTTLNLSGGHVTGLPSVNGVAINPSSVGATTPGSGAFTALSTTGVTVAGNLTLSGYFNSDGGAIYSDGNGTLYIANNVFSFAGFELDGNGSSFDYGNINTDGSGNVYVNTLTANEGVLIRSSGCLFDYGAIQTDGSGNLYTQGAINCSNDFESDGGSVYTDGNGSFFAVNANFSTFGAWGQAPPRAQSETPTTLAGVISILQAYGLCH